MHSNNHLFLFLILLVGMFCIMCTQLFFFHVDREIITRLLFTFFFLFCNCDLYSLSFKILVLLFKASIDVSISTIECLISRSIDRSIFLLFSTTIIQFRLIYIDLFENLRPNKHRRRQHVKSI